MKEFSTRDYRLSRARRIDENAFGIIASIFRVFNSPIAMKIVTARQIVLATTSLHNSLRRGKRVNSDVEVSVDTA